MEWKIELFRNITNPCFRFLIWETTLSWSFPHKDLELCQASFTWQTISSNYHRFLFLTNLHCDVDFIDSWYVHTNDMIRFRIASHTLAPPSSQNCAFLTVTFFILRLRHFTIKKTQVRLRWTLFVNFDYVKSYFQLQKSWKKQDYKIFLEQNIDLAYFGKPLKWTINRQILVPKKQPV